MVNVEQLEMYAILDRSKEGELNRLLLRIRQYGELLDTNFQDALTKELARKHECYLDAFPEAQKLY